MRLPLLLASVCLLAPAQRDLKLDSSPDRHALVIGNDAYPKWPLRNPGNDARGMAEALREVGFKTDVVLNAGLRGMEEAINRFVARLGRDDVAMFYYAGHGIQIGGDNYLVPVDFDAKDEADAKYVSYSASRIQERMDNSGARLNIVVLDACRNNPFRASRSAAGGLAAMGTGRGTLIAFATSPGKTADDNPSGAHGLFTSHLITALREPGLSLDQVFNRVRERVYTESGRQQLPWTVSSVIGEFQFQPAGSAPAPVKNPLAKSAVAVETRPQNPLARKQAESPAPPPQPAADAALGRLAYERGDFQESVRIAMELLRGQPQDKDALFLLVSSHYRSQQYDLFESSAVQALRAGVELPFLLAHHHTLTGGHSVSLKLGGGALAFDPGGPNAPCNQKAFSVPLASVTEASVISSDRGEIFLNVKLRDAQNKIRNFNFADGESTLDTSSGLPRIVSPPKAQRMLSALASVLRQSAKP